MSITLWVMLISTSGCQKVLFFLPLFFSICVFFVHQKYFGRSILKGMWILLFFFILQMKCSILLIKALLRCQTSMCCFSNCVTILKLTIFFAIKCRSHFSSGSLRVDSLLALRISAQAFVPGAFLLQNHLWFFFLQLWYNLLDVMLENFNFGMT